MSRLRNISLGLLAAALVSSVANAQTPPKFYASFNVGGQFAERTLNSQTSQTMYEETATLTAAQPVGNGAVIDFGDGYRVWRNFSAGLVISRFSNTQDATYTASVPDPLFFGRPKTVTGAVSDLRRTEVGIHPHVAYTHEFTDKISGSFGVGLAVIMLKQDLVGDFAVPAGTQNVLVTQTSESGTATGVYAAIDVAYALTSRYGVGGYFRYAGGKADLDSAQDLDVGGAQAGVGVRVRF